MSRSCVRTWLATRTLCTLGQRKPPHVQGLRAQVDGQAHVVHAEEEAQGTRLGIDSLTCLLANEADPSRLTAMSPGKLMKFLVPDGAHVEPDQPYAEVEVGPPPALG